METLDDKIICWKCMDLYVLQTWALCCYTLLMIMKWWKKWIDFVEIKFHLNDIAHQLEFNSIQILKLNSNLI
jgi:hypothetical protein